MTGEGSVHAEKHAHMDANKHANLRAKWDVNKGNLSSKHKRLQCHYSRSEIRGSFLLCSTFFQVPISHVLTYCANTIYSWCFFILFFL